jgi:hypothetical protein
VIPGLRPVEIARPYFSDRDDSPRGNVMCVDTFIRLNDRHFAGDFDDMPIELRTVKDVERENDGDILDDELDEDVTLH